MTYMQWLSVGLLEFVVPGTYLIWFGFAAFVMSIVVTLYTLTVTNQVIIFSIISAIFAVIGLYVYRKLMHYIKTPHDNANLNNPTAQYIGRSYKLLQDSVDGHSKVAIGDGEWLVECPSGLKAGTFVKITAVRDGLVLIAESSK